MGGLAFLKSPAGRLFFDFAGETFLRSDISSSVPELGSILEHEGVVGAAEASAARLPAGQAHRPRHKKFPAVRG